MLYAEWNLATMPPVTSWARTEVSNFNCRKVVSKSFSLFPLIVKTTLGSKREVLSEGGLSYKPLTSVQKTTLLGCSCCANTGIMVSPERIVVFFRNPKRNRHG